MNDPKFALPPVANSALDLIGHTPMMEVRNLDTGLCRLFLKRTRAPICAGSPEDA